MMPKELFANRYLLNEELGRGGMGIVYDAVDRLSGQKVALKQVLAPIDVITVNPTDNDNEQIALAREFQTLASLRHPHIINVLDYGFHKQGLAERPYPFFTMTLLNDALNIMQASKHLSNEGKLYLIIQVLQALEYLHKRGIVHHDLKPSNILVFAEQIKLLDFGLAIKPGESMGTQGTLPYMAPELLDGNPATIASDLYAVGIIAYELFVGRHPFNVKNLHNLLKDILRTPPNVLPLEKVSFDDMPGLIEPDRYSDFDTTQIFATHEDIKAFYSEVQHPVNQNKHEAEEVPIPKSSLARIIFRLLAKDPAARYATANAVMQDFNALLDSPFFLETPEIRESYLQASSFVGRTQEQSLLTEAVYHLNDNQGSAWLIGGESGVGKTRLIDEIRIKAMVEGALVLVGQAVKGGGVPYQVWRNIMRRLCLMVELSELEARVIKPLIPDIERLLEKQIDDPPELNSNETKIRLVTTITNIIKRYPDPLVLILEDLQWANESLDILNSVLAICDENSLVIIGSFRDDERPKLPQNLPQMHFIKLARLNDDEIAKLSVSMLGVLGMQPHILKLLNKETEGNVFFLIETVRVLAEEAGQLSKIATLELPTTIFARGIQDIVDRRLSGIAPEYQAILQLSSIMGREINLPLLEHITQHHVDYLKDLNKWLDVCSSSAIIEISDQVWRFTHDKIRQGIMEQISSEDSIQLHKRVALAIEDMHEDLGDYAVTLARHWQLAGDSYKEMEYISLAGNSALERGNLVEASQNLNRALELYASLAIEDQYWYLDNLHKLAKAYLHQGAFDEGLDACEQCLSMAHELDHKKLIVDATYLRGSIALRQGQIDMSQKYLRMALDLSRNLDNIEMICLTLMWLGALAIMEKEFSVADEYLEESLTRAKELDDYDAHLASILNTQAENLRYQKRFEEAIPFYEQSIKIYTHLGHVYALSAIPLNLAHANFAMGNWELAERKYYNILENSLSQNNRIFTLDCLAGLAGTKYKQGEFLDAVQIIGLVMRHPSTTAETKLLITQPIIDQLQQNLDETAYEHGYHEIDIDSLEDVAKNMLQLN